MEELKSSPFPFSIQLDESTDVSQLLAYVRYMHADAITVKKNSSFASFFLKLLRLQTYYRW